MESLDNTPQFTSYEYKKILKSGILSIQRKVQDIPNQMGFLKKIYTVMRPPQKSMQAWDNPQIILLMLWTATLYDGSPAPIQSWWVEHWEC